MESPHASESIEAKNASIAPIKVIATDIDGTILRDDGTLSARVRRALHDAVDAGLIVVPATGRPLQMADEIIKASGLDGYWVYANGSLTRHEGRDEIIRAFYIDYEDVLSVIESIRLALPNCGFAIEFDDGLAYESTFAEVVPESLIDGEDDILKPIVEARIRGAKIVKLLAFDISVDTIESLKDQVDAATGKVLSSTNSGLRFIELAADKITKAYALDLLVADYGIDPSEVAAFGDNQNDLAMLRWAGHSFAMGNGTPDARATAGAVIETNQADGVALKIEEILARQG